MPVASRYEHADEYPQPLVERMKELGLFGATIPVEYGGLGLDYSTYSMIVEELCRGWMSLSGVLNTHLMFAYVLGAHGTREQDRKSTRLNSSHLVISYAVFCLKKKRHCYELLRLNNSRR